MTAPEAWPANFSLAELKFSTVAIRKGIVNTPTQKQAERLREFAWEVLQPARDALGRIRVDSGYRSPSLNAAVGGSVGSDHLIRYKRESMTCAADLVSIDADLLTLFRWLWRHAPWSRLIWEYGEWVHVSFGEDRQGRVPLRTGHGPTEDKYVRLAMRPEDFNG